MRSFRLFVISILLLGPLVAGGAFYARLISDGSVSPPDLENIVQTVVPAAQGGIALMIGLAAAFVAICAIAAPILYAARSGDPLTVLVSLVLTVSAIAVFFTAKSSIQEILAVLIYLASMVLSSIVYAAHRIMPDDRSPHIGRP